ncbi:MAG: hypothetical protein E6R08_01480 [Nevskiaceae bacterium]|nr:MAG: hypothetical protein E6R08_01480 [Nevskiaceae bacterium]
MQEIGREFLTQVCGGEITPASAMNNACKGLPDSAKVTFEVNTGSTIGINSTTSQALNKLTIETTCGELKKPTPDPKSTPAPNPTPGTGDGKSTGGKPKMPPGAFIIEGYQSI